MRESWPRLDAARYICGKLIKACDALAIAANAMRSEVVHMWCHNVFNVKYLQMYSWRERSTTEVW